MFAAAYTNDTTVQQRIIDQIWARVATNATDFGVFWNVYGLNGNKNLLAQNIKYVIWLSGVTCSCIHGAFSSLAHLSEGSIRCWL